MLKNRLRTLILVLIFLTGAVLLAYPTVANVWNERHATRAISEYAEVVNEVQTEDYAELWSAALAYNQRITDNPGYELSAALRQEYNSVLNVSGLGILGYVEAPAIKLSLPIYHSTDPGVLQIAAGHIEWTNLPIGGLGTHCAISGHRGLASAKLFSDLPKLNVGDVFYIRVLNELLTYEVDQIKTVLPYELDDMRAERGKDYFTLITCTPYGINTHRLLVRGHRIENSAETKRVLVPADAVRIEPLLVAPVLAVPIILMLIILVFLAPAKPKIDPKQKFRLETGDRSYERKRK